MLPPIHIVAFTAMRAPRRVLAEAAGRPVLIQKRGKPFAYIVPPPLLATPHEPPAEAMRRYVKVHSQSGRK